jgi:hypothetical protein
MTTLVMAHGGRDPGKRELKVPAGMKIDFYADFDENMFFTNGLAVVTRGQLGPPNQSYAAGSPIPNYFYQALDSDQLGWYLQLDRSGLPTWFVGNDLPDNTSLCTDHDNCDAWGANDGSGYHSCDGILGKAHEAGETHVVVLACRGNMGRASNPATRDLVNTDGTRDDSFEKELEGEVGRFLALTPTEQETTWAGWPENTKLTFMPFPQMKAWADAYGAKQLWRSEGPKAFAAYYEKLDPAAQDLINADAQAANGVFAGRALKYFDDDPAGFPAWFDGLSADEKTDLLQDPGIYAWHQGRGAGTAADTAADPSAPETPAPWHLSAADEANETFVKNLDEDVDATWEVGGFLVQLGDGHATDDLVRAQPDYAYGTFQVRRATFGAGKLAFTGVAPAHQATITAAVGRFSDKKVVFE